MSFWHVIIFQELPYFLAKINVLGSSCMTCANSEISHFSKELWFYLFSAGVLINFGASLYLGSFSQQKYNQSIATSLSVSIYVYYNYTYKMQWVQWPFSTTWSFLTPHFIIVSSFSKSEKLVSEHHQYFYSLLNLTIQGMKELLTNTIERKKSTQ